MSTSLSWVIVLTCVRPRDLPSSVVRPGENVSRIDPPRPPQQPDSSHARIRRRAPGSPPRRSARPPGLAPTPSPPLFSITNLKPCRNLYLFATNSHLHTHTCKHTRTYAYIAYTRTTPAAPLAYTHTRVYVLDCHFSFNRFPILFYAPSCIHAHSHLYTCTRNILFRRPLPTPHLTRTRTYTSCLCTHQYIYICIYQ